MMLRICSVTAFFVLGVSLLQGKDETPANLIAGKQVGADVKLQKGDKLVAVYEKKNYVVEVREIKSNNKLRILWVSTGEETDDVSQTELYYAGDSTPTRKSRTSPLPEAYRAFDKNGDGQIGLYEWDRAKYAEFRKLDKNRDGFLTPQELASKSSVVATSPNVASSVANVASLVKEGDPNDPRDMRELPNPGTLDAFEEKFNESFTFSVTGKTTGGVWGTGIYATESDLAAAAVHAGVLKVGTTGPVKVTILASADKFTGSAANGVTTADRQEAGPAFTVEAAKVEAEKK